MKKLTENETRFFDELKRKNNNNSFYKFEINIFDVLLKNKTAKLDNNFLSSFSSIFAIDLDGEESKFTIDENRKFLHSLQNKNFLICVNVYFDVYFICIFVDDYERKEFYDIVDEHKININIMLRSLYDAFVEIGILSRY